MDRGDRKEPHHDLHHPRPRRPLLRPEPGAHRVPGGQGRHRGSRGPRSPGPAEPGLPAVLDHDLPRPATEWLAGQLAEDAHGFLLTGSNIPEATVRHDKGHQPTADRNHETHGEPNGPWCTPRSPGPRSWPDGSGHQLSLTPVISKCSTRSSAPWPKRFGPSTNAVGNAYGGSRDTSPGVSGRQPAVEQAGHWRMRERVPGGLILKDMRRRARTTRRTARTP